MNIVDVRTLSEDSHIDGYRFDSSGEFLSFKHGFITLYSPNGNRITSLSTIKGVKNLIKALELAAKMGEDR